MSEETKARVYIVGILRCVIFGSAFVGMKIALESINPMMVIFARYLIAAIIVFLILGKVFPGERIKREDYKKFVVLGVLEPILFYIVFGYGIKYTSAIRATIVLSIAPAMIASLAVPILKEKLTAIKIVTIMGSIVGVYLVVIAKEPAQPMHDYLLGDLLILFAGICHALYIVYARKLSFRYSFITITRFQTIIGVVGFLPFMLFELFIFNAPVPSLSSIIAVFYLGIVVSVVGFLSINYTIAKLSAANSSIFQNLVPGVTVVLSIIILGEYAGLQKIAGLVISSVCVFLLSWYERKRPQIANP